MTQHVLNLPNRSESRHALNSPSSANAGSAGLSMIDIVPRLVERKLSASIPSTPPTLEERVFKALADAKIWTSRVAMHLDASARNRYFRQLDLLHDCDEWAGNDLPLALESYKSFIRFMLMIGGEAKPSLALTGSGNLLAIWQNEAGRLSVEFLPANSVEWVITKGEGDLIEQAAGRTSLTRLLANLAPYHPTQWFRLG